jgi:hypothetical protein
MRLTPTAIILRTYQHQSENNPIILCGDRRNGNRRQCDE